MQSRRRSVQFWVASVLISCIYPFYNLCGASRRQCTSLFRHLIPGRPGRSAYSHSPKKALIPRAACSGQAFCVVCARGSPHAYRKSIAAGRPSTAMSGCRARTIPRQAPASPMSALNASRLGRALRAMCGPSVLCGMSDTVTQCFERRPVVDMRAGAVIPTALRASRPAYRERPWACR